MDPFGGIILGVMVFVVVESAWYLWRRLQAYVPRFDEGMGTLEDE